MPPPTELSLCSEKELTSCSLQVLDAAGSPARTFLAWLADRGCPMDFLLHCLRKMDNKEALQFLTTTGKTERAGCSSLFPGSVSGLQISQQPQTQAASEGDVLVMKCKAEANPPPQYEWYHNKMPIPQQKACSLKRDLTFTVCLHYTYSNMDEEVQERLPVTVGKPLVSKLNLHEPRTSRSCSAYSYSSLDSFNYPECSSFTSVDSAVNTWPYHGQTGSAVSPSNSLTSPRSANVPEETDSPGIFDSPQPLTSSKSLPHCQVNEMNYKFSDMYNFHSF
ncbi:hypothetical protein XENOCAPTIV_014667 [Xenoophorus captivus]|uniref:MALT1 immunoglobulin-like domain-containing protein n=1 Tax=Xenoophorus captivus TaxID=1517983 RepID=A0ABV0QLY0_9TELE